MSLAFGRNNDNSSSIRRSGFLHGMQCISVYGSPEEGSEDRSRLSSTVEVDDDDLGSCSSSSIGRNSDDSCESQSDDDDSPEAEVQSQPKGPLDTVDALEEVLPMRLVSLDPYVSDMDAGHKYFKQFWNNRKMFLILGNHCLRNTDARHGHSPIFLSNRCLANRKGISQFYNGKSKSFTSLADAAAASSVKDFAKPEDPYNKKRKNLLVCSSSLDRKRNNPLRNYVTEISKRVTNTNRSIVALGSTTSSRDIDSTASSPSSCLPPLHPPCKKSTTIRPSSSSTNRPNPSCRSFSLSDLQFVAAGTPNIAGLAVHSGTRAVNCTEFN